MGTYVDKVLSSELSGNVIDLCPVGSITKKTFLKQKSNKDYNPYKNDYSPCEYSCKHYGDNKCCQAPLRRFNGGKIICCYENGCYHEPCFECFRNKINGFNCKRERERDWKKKYLSKKTRQKTKRFIKNYINLL